MHIPYQPILTALNNLQSNQLHVDQSEDAIYTETLHAEFIVSCWDISSSHFFSEKTYCQYFFILTHIFFPKLHGQNGCRWRMLEKKCFGDRFKPFSWTPLSSSPLSATFWECHGASFVDKKSTVIFYQKNFFWIV